MQSIKDKEYLSIELNSIHSFSRIAGHLFVERYKEELEKEIPEVDLWIKYIDYDKEKAIKELHDVMGFEYYGGKHCESIFTRLYQNYILPVKYGVNKTKAHYSSLIVAGQLERDKAIEMLKTNEYTNNPELLEKDIKDFIQKIKITRDEFDKIMSDGVVRPHDTFKNYNKRVEVFRKMKRMLMKANIIKTK